MTEYEDDDELSFHHQVPHIFRDVDWNDVAALIDRLDSGPMSEPARHLAQQQKQTILFKRRQLVNEKLVMRPSFKGYSFHTYPAREFERKSSEYLEQREDTYRLVQNINATSPNVSQQCLTDIVRRVETTLQELLCCKLITDQQYAWMQPRRSDIRLNYLCFVPDTYKEGVPLEPIVICKDGPSVAISRYLSDVLWSILDQTIGCKTLTNESDAVLALESYRQQGHLRPTTLFATFNVHHLCTMFPHEVTINALEELLEAHGSEQQTCGLTNETIVRLVRLVLKNQFFVYQNQVYRQTIGGGSGSLVTLPLACIYLFHRLPGLITGLSNSKHELLARCRDDLFLTWNGSIDQLCSLLDAPIRISPSMGTTVHFLDVELSHVNGVLHTKLHRDPVTKESELRCRLAYQTDHLSRLFQAAFIDTVCGNSAEIDFHQEARYITQTYVSAGFSTASIKQCIQQFHRQFDVGEMRDGTRVVPYDKLRQCVLKHHQQQQVLKKETVPMLPRTDRPLTMNDYLVDTKPSRQLLMLSESERNKKCAS